MKNKAKVFFKEQTADHLGEELHRHIYSLNDGRIRWTLEVKK